MIIMIVIVIVAVGVVVIKNFICIASFMLKELHDKREKSIKGHTFYKN